jgi:haloacetate dehalogenase
MWHKVAHSLASRFSLVIADLRGYGESTGPPADPDHVGYSKRTMAADMIGVMAALGHERFAVAGHDRGGRVAYRLALDHPERVSRLAALDIVPTFDVWRMMNAEFVIRMYHWAFLAQPAPMPEHLIGQDPDAYLTHVLDKWTGLKGSLDPAAVAEYAHHYRKRSVIHASCEDYRAGATIDREHDRLDREAGRQIACPTLIVWGNNSMSLRASKPLQVWRTWAADVREVELDCGHFVPEELPEACAAALMAFFAEEEPASVGSLRAPV